jgi:hypothetical protein
MMKSVYVIFRNLLFIGIRKIIFLFSISFFFVVLILFSCTNKSGEQDKNVSASMKEKTVWTETDEKALNELLKSFNSTKDISNNIVWYSHKNIPAAETNLHAEVNGTDNYCYLISMYCGKSPLSHDSVQVKYGEDFVSTKKISPPDRRNRKSNFKDLLFETIHFTEGTDNNIPELIALNYDKKIIVKLIGQKQNHEYILSNKLKRSIKDAYELTILLKKKSSAS